MMKKNQEIAESKMGGKFDEKSKEKPKSKDGKAGKSRSPSPGDPSVPNGPSDPPDDPPHPPGQPPGFPPSLRRSTYDDNMSQSNITVAEIPRVWSKFQDVESWKSDVMKSVTLAANDGDRVAWQEWILPAVADNPDLDALNDSGAARFQSIDTKLSIALPSVIHQAGGSARDVAMQLRHRTQAAGRRASFVMG